jgi:UDP-N-acetylglucosamine:LPS N-acetylglucosamine transferase
MNNTQFLLNQQAALKLDRAADIHEAVRDLLGAPQKLTALTRAAQAIGKPNAAVDIARLILEKAAR